ncbi:MAG TPA: hypothetical protein PK874_02385 [Desulfobacteraceae bacterium]|nr:hypothetical protein [Desulfobacteraceae bacterium]
MEKFKHQKALLRKIAKTINFLEDNPHHPSLRIERITNDPAAWSARVDRKYRISFEPVAFLATGIPDWTSRLILLRILDHDDLYKAPR